MPPTREVARYKLPYPGTSLVVSIGSIADFSGDVIINSANSGCLAGGGVDGAVTEAGGRNLARDRFQLPVLRQDRMGRDIRCEVGSAVLTGPNDYGRLPPLIVHAVGPNVNSYRNVRDAIRLLQSAYASSLDILYQVQKDDSVAAETKKIRVVGFSLLSAGVFRGRLSLEDVLFVAIETIRDWCEQMYHRHIEDGIGLLAIKEIHLCGFTQQECHALKEVCSALLGERIRNFGGSHDGSDNDKSNRSSTGEEPRQNPRPVPQRHHQHDVHRQRA